MSNCEPDLEIQQIAEGYALDMIDYAKQTYGIGIDLDWSDDSVQQVERIAAVLHDEYEKAPPSDEQTAPFYKMLGSNIREVFRRNYAAKWDGLQCKVTAFLECSASPTVCFGRGVRH